MCKNINKKNVNADKNCSMCFDTYAKMDCFLCRCCLKSYCGSCRDTVFVERRAICFFCISKNIKRKTSIPEEKYDKKYTYNRSITM